MKYIEQFRESDNINDIYLIKHKQAAVTKNGKPYENVILQDKTGSIDGKIWDPNSAGIEDYDVLDYCLVGGNVTSFNGQLQANIKRKTADTERLAKKHIDSGGKVDAQLTIHRFALFLNIAVHTDAEISCGSHECQLLSLLLHLYYTHIALRSQPIRRKIHKIVRKNFWRNCLLNVFEAIKGNVTTRQAAEMYGIRVNRYGMAVCPFHNDKNPSMKVDKRFHCFACQADGDAVDFVSRLFGLPSKEAAMKIADDFGIRYDSRQRAADTEA